MRWIINNHFVNTLLLEVFDMAKIFYVPQNRKDPHKNGSIRPKMFIYFFLNFNALSYIVFHRASYLGQGKRNYFRFY